MPDVNEVLWSEHARGDFAGFVQRGAVIVLPVGSLEQHGTALPVDTDGRVVEHMARGAACAAKGVPVLVMPTLAVGISPHHMTFPGSLTLRVETLVRVLGDVCDSIVHQGFRRILFVNGHGGNADTLRAAALENTHRLCCLVRAVSWWDLVPEVFASVCEGPVKGIGHAGEAEASLLLALTPGSVRTDRLDLVEGVTDRPARATASKGQAILRAAIEALAEYLRDMAKAPGTAPVGIPMAEQP